MTCCTHSSALPLDAGAPLAYVSEQMGHASTVITAQIYIHNLAKSAGFVRNRPKPRRKPSPVEASTASEIPSEVIDERPSRIRTWNQQIMSPKSGVDTKENQPLTSAESGKTELNPNPDATKKAS
jgi:hypothetical protein